MCAVACVLWSVCCRHRGLARRRHRSQAGRPSSDSATLPTFAQATLPSALQDAARLPCYRSCGTAEGGGAGCSLTAECGRARRLATLSSTAVEGISSIVCRVWLLPDSGSLRPLTGADCGRARRDITAAAAVAFLLRASSSIAGAAAGSRAPLPPLGASDCRASLMVARVLVLVRPLIGAERGRSRLAGGDCDTSAACTALLLSVAAPSPFKLQSPTL